MSITVINAFVLAAVAPAAFPTYVAAGTFAGGNADVFPGVPAGYAAGDIFLMYVETANEPVAAPAGGWAAVNTPTGTGAAGSGTSTALQVFWKRATGSESEPTVTGTTNHKATQIEAWRGCKASGTPFEAVGGDIGASSTSVTIPGLTTLGIDRIVIAAVGHGIDTVTGQGSGFANGDLANFTTRLNIGTGTLNGGGFVVCSGEKATAGVVGSTTGTLASAHAQERVVFALIPA